MSAINHGGPAFPTQESGGDPWGKSYREGAPGMTLRDWMAGKAIPLAVRRLEHNWTRDMGNEWYWNDKDFDDVAEIAYLIADAMLRARESTS